MRNSPQGDYFIQTTDESGCTDTISASVPQVALPIITGIDATASTCLGSDGSLNVLASGGTGALLYSLNEGLPQDSGLFTALPSARLSNYRSR
ncbi:MAG: hypothetical protein R2795_14705 [Saprospiraceae bacterium]